MKKIGLLLVVLIIGFAIGAKREVIWAKLEQLAAKPTPTPEVPPPPPPPPPAAPAMPGGEAQQNLNWCIGNSDALGSVDCPQEYPYPECIAVGGRSCLMRKAIDSAKANDCANAFRLSQICQCHNAGAKQSVIAAGQDAVCNYLKTK